MSVDVLEGDALKIVPTLEAGRFDLACVDPPYSSGGATRGDRVGSTTSKYVTHDSGNAGVLEDFDGDTRDQRGFGYWSTLWLLDVRRVVREGGVLLASIDWRQLPTLTDAVQAAGWVWRGIVPWSKTEAVRPQLGRPRAQCEYYIFATNGPHHPYDGAPAIPGFYEVPTERERVHITQKPIALMLELVKLAPLGGEVLDCFAGSASTGIACLRQGRNCTLIESNPKIARIARERLEAERQGLTFQAARSGQQPIFKASR